MLPDQRLVFIRHAADFRSPVSLVGIVVRDMRASLKLYRLLGLDIPEGVEDEPHTVKVVPRLFVWIYQWLRSTLPWAGAGSTGGSPRVGAAGGVAPAQGRAVDGCVTARRVSRPRAACEESLRRGSGVGE